MLRWLTRLLRSRWTGAEADRILLRMAMTYYSVGAKRGAAKGPVQIVPLAEHNNLALITAAAPIIADPRFRVEEGVKWNDFLPFTFSSHFAISEKVMTLLKDNEVTGVDTYPIQIEGAEQPYYVCVMTSKAPRWRNEAAVREYQTEVHEMDMTGFLDLDALTVEGTTLDLFSERAIGLLKKAKVKGLDANPFLIEHVASS